MKRGDVVMVDFPYSDGSQAKVRPAVVVQHDRYNQMWSKTVVALVTGNIKRQHDPAHLLVDPRSDPGTGLWAPSLVSCPNQYTIDQKAILRRLGELSGPLLAQLDDCLIEALGITRG